MSKTSNRLLLGLGLAGLILDGIASHPAFAIDRVSLFRVVTHGSDIVIGLSRAELEQLHAGSSSDLTRHLEQQGTLSAWQYGVRKAEAQGGTMQQIPVRRIDVSIADTVRIEPYMTPLRIMLVNFDKTGQ